MRIIRPDFAMLTATLTQGLGAFKNQNCIRILAAASLLLMVVLWAAVPLMGQAQGTNTAPTAVDDTAATDENTAVDITVVANDTDADGDTLSVTSVTTPSNGTAAIVSGSTTTVTYTPDTGFNGSDSFGYTLSDGTDTDFGMVTVTVGPPAQPTGLTAAGGDAQAALTWDDPSNGSITGYEYLQARIAELTASDGATWEIFGYSVAVDGDTMVAAAPYDNDNGNASGSAYVFIRQSGTWSQAAKLTASDGALYDQFGYSVAVDGDTVVVGARYDDDNGSNSGSAYVFTKPGAGWTSTSTAAKLTASDGAADDWFGASVAVDGDTVVVGASLDDDNGSTSGSAYVFTKPENGWTSTSTAAKLTASDGAAADWFGASVAVDGDTVVAGAYGDDDNGDKSGSAYLFTKPENGWTSTNTAAKLTASDGAASDYFGYSVAVDGDTVVAGAYWDDDNGDKSGSAYLFTKPATGWTSTSTAAKLTASDGEANDEFGRSVALDGDRVVVGAYWDDDNGSDSGSAYLFTKPANGGWATATETAKLIAPDGATGDNFGVAVAVDGDTVAVGAHGQDDNGAESGSAYVYAVSAWTAAPDSGAGETNATSYTVTGLTNDAEYSFRLRAVNAFAKGAASGIVTVTPTNTAPTAVDDIATTDEDSAVDINVVANDTDPDDGTTLSVTGVTTPSNGTAAIASGSTTTITYTPDASFNGTDTLDYTVSDGTDTDTGTVTITVNTIPVGVDDSVTTDEDAAVDINVVANDTDPDSGANLSVTAVTTPSSGTAVVAEGSSTTVTYTPNANFNGTDSFDYTVSDGTHTDTGTVTVTVTAVNDAPVAVNDTVTTAEDTAVDIYVAANDTDIEGDTLSVTAVTTPSNGTVIASGNTTTVTYTPNANFNGTDSFDYTVSDGTDTDTGTVTVTVNAVPVAVDDTATTAEDNAVDINVATNDTDADGDTLSVTAVTTPSSGTAVVAEDSSTTVTYTPNANFNGTDSFDYTVSDGTHTDTGTVTVTVTAVNDAPVAVNDTVTTAEDTAVDIDVVANDTDIEGDTLSVTAVTTPSNGTAVVAEGSSTTVTYTPDASFTGTDSFDYTVSDGTDTDTGTVTVTVNAVPVAVDDTATTAEDNAVDINVATNDTDADGATLSVTAVTTPSSGTAVVAEGSSTTVTYTPNANFNGTDSFDYTVSDGTHTDTGTVTVTVTAVNDAPVAVNDTVTTAEDTAVDIYVAANDTDIEGDTLSVTAVTTPSNGTVIASGNTTTVTYTPDAGFTGTDSFDYTVSDGTDTDTGTVTVTVTGT